MCYNFKGRKGRKFGKMSLVNGRFDLFVRSIRLSTMDEAFENRGTGLHARDIWQVRYRFFVRRGTMILPMIVSNELVVRSHGPSRTRCQKGQVVVIQGGMSFILARSFPEIASYKNSISGLS